ncbi:GlsB/YeaQ/YmgE family stress response membrane protein [Crenobacter caeni]|uniref:GlsB/YeaQ/YmgE family stress response membrane protein n=1 Tax=Crenobacter caeni TaxID=2705474 RepID=A0A6B2KSH9_9NEIS|nr:GlsB/YeaQ/YmgE family stress response membrane protein [Crenobacter caeni]NDV12929.1 GlsB/YeaQ/YmgE family stress response membrane protein [Crenobacter caeni]
MGWIITLIVGALIGWLASKVMGTDAQQGAIANILVGIVGSALGRWVFGDLLGFSSADAAGSFSLSGLAFGILGAVILIFVLKLVGVFK